MVSVIIPTYNRARYLKKSLESLLSQDVTSNSFEVIVVDDGSGDGTKKIVESFRDKLNIRYIHQNHHGVSKARNRGVKESSGNILLFFDDDALASYSWVSKTARIMEDEDIITGSIEPINDNMWKYFAPHYNQGDKPIQSSVLLEGNCAFKKHVFDDIGGFDENLTYGHEGEELISRASAKYKIMYYPEVVIKHDYAFGLFNYLNKQFKFGHKMSYLKIDGIKSLMDLLFHYKEIKRGKKKQQSRGRNISFFNKVMVFIISKLGLVFHFTGAIIGYLKYKK